MRKKVYIIEITKSSMIIGSETLKNFILSYEVINSNPLTELEANIYGFFLIDYFLHSKPISKDLRLEYFNFTVNHFISLYQSHLSNNRAELDKLIEYRFNKYAGMVETYGENWQRNINDYLEAILNGTINTNKMSKDYPFEIIGIVKASIYKISFIQQQIEIIQTAAIISNGLNDGKKLYEINNLTKHNNSSNSQKKGCYIATMVYGDYDCYEVKILRNFRDNVLEKNLFGRLFIKLYYYFSPTFVKIFKDNNIINKIIKNVLDKIVFILKKI